MTDENKALLARINAMRKMFWEILILKRCRFQCSWRN